MIFIKNNDHLNDVVDPVIYKLAKEIIRLETKETAIDTHNKSLEQAEEEFESHPWARKPSGKPRAMSTSDINTLSHLKEAKDVLASIKETTVNDGNQKDITLSVLAAFETAYGQSQKAWFSKGPFSSVAITRPYQQAITNALEVLEIDKPRSQSTFSILKAVQAAIKSEESPAVTSGI
ncbi:hypothetical protein [Legionella spiritensis]|uniref:Uncharacterized protein n=1 Tax=Legionella spiritensis TaxID=452 RepID=A0A0W0YWX9_LEGSP|nr:hypothetical protein [Legionella spiritensis]KTD61429.1 hypothetical protein Lspi_2671 [Legionella spiritensis]SNV33982.1 Uncharacterised protein [Legionella spiritensis]